MQELNSGNISLQGQSEITNKIRRTALTSVKSYLELLHSGQIKNEQAEIYNAVKNYGPVTSRMLIGISGLERGSICRCIKNLEDAEAIEVAYNDKCKITGKTVRYYRAKAAEGLLNVV